MSNSAAVAFVRSPTVRRVRAQARAIPYSHPFDDVRLFATTFVVGFLFVSLYLA